MCALVMSVALAASASWAKTDKEDPSKIGSRDVGKGVNFYSLEKEIQIGKQLAAEVEKQARIVDDSVISEYVNRIGQNLVRNSDAKVPFTIKVIDSEEVNAFALPGGYLFVNTGLILKASNESELAGVLAHEIAHVAARHGTRQATRGQIVNIASIPLIFMGGWPGYAVQQASSLAIPLGFLKFSRNMEEEADMLGIQYLYKAGYDPLSFVNFFEKLQAEEKKKPGTIAKVFSSHPPTNSRIKKSQKHIQELLEPQPEYAVTTSEFDEVRSRLERLQSKRKIDNKDPNRPTLKRRTGSDKIDVNGDDKNPQKDHEEEDEDRPTLKRRN
jgi:predicted Zn-dependent protease